jgi:hypothetical protein
MAMTKKGEVHSFEVDSGTTIKDGVITGSSKSPRNIAIPSRVGFA